MSARVEPEWAMVTVMFVDIRGFTAFADRSTAREAVDLLNEFFEVALPLEDGPHDSVLHGPRAGKPRARTKSSGISRIRVRLARAGRRREEDREEWTGKKCRGQAAPGSRAAASCSASRNF